MISLFNYNIYRLIFYHLINLPDGCLAAFVITIAFAELFKKVSGMLSLHRRAIFAWGIFISGDCSKVNHRITAC